MVYIVQPPFVVKGDWGVGVVSYLMLTHNFTEFRSYSILGVIGKSRQRHISIGGQRLDARALYMLGAIW